MAGDRRSALNVKFMDLGAGQVVRNLPSEMLVQPNPQGLAPTPAVPNSTNLTLFEGLVRRRAGYTEISNAGSVTAQTITGLYWAQFGPRSNQLVAAGARNDVVTESTILVFNESANTWSSIHPVGVTIRSLTNQPWAFAMVPSADPTLPTYMITGNEASAIYRWDGQISQPCELLSTDAPEGPRVLTSFLSRAFAANVLVAGERYGRRLQWSIVGDPSDWTGLGSGFIDMEDDPYEIVAALVMGGRLVVFKGGPNGGAIYLCTPTGVSVAPLRIDAVNPGTNVGALIPRAVVPINPSLTFFLGHDAAYLYDGVRALLPFAHSVSRDIISRLNFNALDTCFGVYRAETREVEIHIATEGNLTPNEMWLFDIQGRRAYGPHSLADSMLAATPWLSQNTLAWNTWGQATSRTWTNLTDAAGNQYYQWDNVLADVGTSRSVVYGDAVGDVYKSRHDTDADDDGTAIACTYTFPAITPDGWSIPADGQTVRTLRPDDVLVLREVTVRHKSTATWTPVVEVSIDGTTWVTTSDATNFTTTAGRLLTKTYYVPNTLAPSQWFQMRIRNTSGDAMNIHSASMRFTYAGSGRHE